ncbi:hypothetical protein EYZ11_006283 [Aspergillus tanneri]|uniref:Uncharacterized protein n=1 Tax=Aspergillus tanneri TaxID=1220188 RepID=A0A4S3JG67_9EURO|nr:hypothetical protein EYZ11_006283 [Aspergillus tanneri]
MDEKGCILGISEKARIQIRSNSRKVGAEL